MLMWRTKRRAPQRAHSVERRRFTVGLLAGFAGLLSPLRAFAEWPKTLFGQTDFDKALAELTQGRKTEKRPMLKTPKIAENGAQVRVSAKLPDAAAGAVSKISFIVEKNPVPLTSQFILGGRSVPSVGVNLKVRETSRIVAVAETAEALYMDEATVQVSAGGCG